EIRRMVTTTPMLLKSLYRAPKSFSVSRGHPDNGRLSIPWREVIFLSTVMDSISAYRRPFSLGQKSALSWTIAGQEVRHAARRDNWCFIPALGRKPAAGECPRTRG